MLYILEFGLIVSIMEEEFSIINRSQN